jgi:plasmid stabilization system protein ParE
MTKPLRFDDEAAEELDAAAGWYEVRRPGLGLDFLAAVREACARLAHQPEACAWVPGLAGAHEARRCLVRIVALSHGHREPGYWRRRR